MVRPVLYDQSNIAFRMGTGIATYARNLSSAACEAGFRVDALVSADIRVDPANPVLSEVRLFSAPVSPIFPRLAVARDVVRGVLRAPFGYNPRLLPRTGVVMHTAGSRLQSFDHTYVGTRLFDEARVYFSVHSRFALIRMSEPPALFHATYPLPLHVKGCPNIVTIHDLVPLRLPYMTLDSKRYYWRLVKKLVEQADHIVTVSEFSRKDIMSVFGVPASRITNTYQAVSLPQKALGLSEDEVSNLVGNLFDLVHRGYWLFVGALEPKKNVRRLIDAYAASGSRRPLLIAGGKGWQNEAELDRIRDPRFSSYRIFERTISRFERVRRIEYLPAEQLVTLMRGARALLFPSLFEGFGLPVLEAMTLGTPVITSNTTSLPEVAGDAALLVDPLDVGSMAAAIRRLDCDDELCAELSARGRIQAQMFSKKAYEARIRKLYDRVLGITTA
jgi:glycosyltransferase involved in cell wall biosynthesis